MFYPFPQKESVLKVEEQLSYFAVNYEPLLQCSWLVEGLEDQVVMLTFTRLELEPPGVNDTVPCPRDRVEVRKWHDSLLPLSHINIFSLISSPLQCNILSEVNPWYNNP